jgi:glutaredoxin
VKEAQMSAGVSPLPVVVLGSPTCEDTAIVRDRLRVVGIPYEYVDVDTDPTALERVQRLNSGSRITPTVVFGDDRYVTAEPSLERLGELAAAAGHEFERPAALDLHGGVTRGSIPLRSVLTPDGRTFSLGELRGKRQVALFLAHGSGCLACFGYARQLASHGAAMDDVDAKVVIAVPGLDHHWQDGLAAGHVLVADADAIWKGAIARHVGVSADETQLLILDRFLAPRALSTADEAGGLPDPAGAIDWLRFLELECPECSGEIEWPEPVLTR